MQDRNFRPNGSGGPPSGPPASILIAEPEELLREALAAFCIAQGGFQLAALSSDGEEALEATAHATAGPCYCQPRSAPASYPRVDFEVLDRRSARPFRNPGHPFRNPGH